MSAAKRARTAGGDSGAVPADRNIYLAWFKNAIRSAATLSAAENQHVAADEFGDVTCLSDTRWRFQLGTDLSNDKPPSFFISINKCKAFDSFRDALQKHGFTITHFSASGRTMRGKIPPGLKFNEKRREKYAGDDFRASPIETMVVKWNVAQQDIVNVTVERENAYDDADDAVALYDRITSVQRGTLLKFIPMAQNPDREEVKTLVKECNFDKPDQLYWALRFIYANLPNNFEVKHADTYISQILDAEHLNDEFTDILMSCIISWAPHGTGSDAAFTDL